MRSNDVLGLVFADTMSDKIPELSASRTVASIPIGGKYRLIDFVLSNMSNSGINNVGIIAKSNFLSLTDHVGSGSAYDLSKRRSNLTLLTPYDGKNFSNEIETVYNMHGYIDHCREEYVLLSPGNVVSNFDYNALFDFHSKHDADVTFVYRRGVVPKEYVRPLTVETDADGKVTQVRITPEIGDQVILPGDFPVQEISQARDDEDDSGGDPARRVAGVEENDDDRDADGAGDAEDIRQVHSISPFRS